MFYCVKLVTVQRANGIMSYHVSVGGSYNQGLASSFAASTLVVMEAAVLALKVARLHLLMRLSLRI